MSGAADSWRGALGESPVPLDETDMIHVRTTPDDRRMLAQYKIHTQHTYIASQTSLRLAPCALRSQLATHNVDMFSIETLLTNPSCRITNILFYIFIYVLLIFYCCIGLCYCFVLCCIVKCCRKLYCLVLLAVLNVQVSSHMCASICRV